MHFDAKGRMTAREDRNRNLTRYHYREDGKLKTLTDPVGLVTAFDYANGKLERVTDPAGRITRFGHDAAGNLTRITFPDATFIRHEYDERHLMLTRFDERGNAYRHRYDDFGRLIDATLPDGTVRTSVSQTSSGLLDTAAGDAIGGGTNPAPLTFADDSEALYVDGRGHLSRKTLDRHGRTLTEVDPLGRITSHLRDADSNPLQTTRPNGSVVVRTFDDFGNVLTRTEAFNGALYQYTYDAFSLPTSVTNPNHHTTTINRDPATGNPTAIVNHLGHTTTFEYDPRGLITRSVSPNGLETLYTYNAQGLVDTQTETPPPESPGNVRVTRYDYYLTGLLKQVVTPDAITLTYQYDDRGDVLSVTDNLGQSLVYTYNAHKNVVKTETTSSDGSLALSVDSVFDSRNRLKQIIAPHSDTEDSVTETILDNNSNLTGLIDPNQNDSRNHYDPFNRLATHAHREGGVTDYTYDDQDRIIRVIAPNGVVTEYENDVLGRRTREISPDRGTLSYTYDLANNLTALTDGRGITATLSYDELERVKTKTYPNTLPGKNENVSYTYDDCPFGLGRLCERRDESGHYRYQYDAYGNLIHTTFTEAAGTSYTLSYGYDDGDRIVEAVYPSGRVIDLQRDGVRRIERIDSKREENAPPQTLLSDIRYRGDHRMTQATYGNGLTDERHYDLQGRLTQQRLRNSLDLSLDQRSYAYDPNGNITHRTGTAQNSRYRHDAQDRLIQEDNAGLAANDYFYDLNDNRLRKDGEHQIETYHYRENSNRLDFTDTLDSSQKTQEPKPLRELVYNDAGRLFQLYEDGRLLKPSRIMNGHRSPGPARPSPAQGDPGGG